MEFEPSNTAMLSMNFLLKYELGILEGKGENAGKNMLMKQIQYKLNLLSIKTIYKTCAIRFLMSQTFKKAKNYQNLTTESGSKQRYSLLQEKVVIQIVCLRTQAGSKKARFQLDLKGGLWVFRKSQKKISIASDQHYLSYVKNQRGGVNWPPPPAGIGLKPLIYLE